MKDKRMARTEKSGFERETRVLLEEIRHDVKTVSEGHGILVRKLDGHDNKLEGIDNKLEGIDNKLIKNDSDHFKLEMLIESVKSRTGTIDVKVDRIERELETVKNAVMDINTVTKNHEERITKIEEKVNV